MTTTAVAEIKPGALAQTSSPGRMAVADIISHVTTVQEVMRAVMKPDVHYGKIPGTDKPTLLKPGAEVLCMTFRIADTYVVEDLSTELSVRYRVTCIGTHQTTGTVLGTGMGEASSGEEKYKWRKATSQQEFEETPANLRRTKHVKPRNGNAFSIQQVRTEPADLANTILKMANKRAKMAMVLNVTAASDCFSQDLEDMDDALRDHLARHGEDTAPQQGEQQQPTGPAAWPDDALEKRLAGWKEAIAKGKTVAEIVAFAESKGTLSPEQRKKIEALAPAAAVTDVAPKVTYAALVDMLQKAENIDALNDAAALINSLPADQQADANVVYDNCRVKLI